MLYILSNCTHGQRTLTISTSMSLRSFETKRPSTLLSAKTLTHLALHTSFHHPPPRCLSCNYYFQLTGGARLFFARRKAKIGRKCRAVIALPVINFSIVVSNHPGSPRSSRWMPLTPPPLQDFHVANYRDVAGVPWIIATSKQATTIEMNVPTSSHPLSSLAISFDKGS